MVTLSSCLRAAVLALALAGGTAVSANYAPEDPMVPPPNEALGTTSPLRMITVATGNMTQTRRFYEGAMGMTGTAQRIDGAAGRALADHWSLHGGGPIELMLFTYPGAPQSVTIRAVAVPASLGAGRPGRDSRYLGPLGFGFASRDIPARDAAAKKLGFRSSAGIKRMDFPRADGTTYNVAEIHWHAPDDILVLGVDRDTMKPVGPIDQAARQGGVAYSSALVGDIERAGKFLREVVGLTRRRAMQFPGGGPDGGMIGLELGEPVAFQQWFAGGSTTNYLVIMERLERARELPAAKGFAARGIALWSFETSDLDGAVRRFRTQGGKVAITRVDLPGIGRRRTAVLRSPDNLTVELIEGNSR